MHGQLCGVKKEGIQKCISTDAFVGYGLVAR